MQDAKEEVRSRLNIEDVIGEYVQLKRAGRNFKGLSPFSGEKTASFVVSPDKHIWHDFSSGRGGDVFTFIMEVEGMDFRQALEHLARKAGVELEVYGEGGKALSDKKKRLFEALDLATNYFQQSLIKNPHAVEYVFKKRGLSKKIVQDFRIGYAPTSGDALVQFLTKKNFTKQELDEAGLVNQYGGDLFRGRMTVPLMDGTGRVIGFTARILTDDDPKSPKYLNTPQTILYNKSRHVFGLSQAKETIRKNDYAVVVEGNMDVISSHQVGVAGVVATAGTAMTYDHLRELKKITENIRLAFDSDKAGLAATERAIQIAEQAEIELMIVELPDGVKDPDELIKVDPELWQKAIDNPEPLIKWVLERRAAHENLKTPKGKERYINEALGIIQLLNDEGVKEQYIQMVANFTQGMVSGLMDRLKAQKEPERKLFTPKKTAILPSSSTYDNTSYQDNLLAVALISSATHKLFKDTDIAMFEGDNRQAVAEFIAQQSFEVIDDTPGALQKYDTYVKILLLKADARYAQWNDQDRYQETARLIRQVEAEHNKKQITVLNEQLRDAETIGDNEKATEIRARINKLIKEINSGKK